MVNILYARHALESIGASVIEIARGTGKTPDLLASFGNQEKILIEEKTKEDSREYLDKRSTVLAAGEIHSFGVPQVRNNRLSGIVRSATKQLSCPVDESVDLRLVWFTATGTRAEATYEQFMATLYGTTRIWELSGSGLRKCYFFRNSDFHRYRAILDGAVVAHVSVDKLSASLCLNPLSPNYQAIKDSTLARAFGTAVFDPLADEAEGVAYIVASDIDRNDEAGLLEFLEKKYETGPIQKFDMGHIGAEVIVHSDASDLPE